MWIFEGSHDRGRPNPYFAAVLRREVHDWSFYSDACALVRMRQDAKEHALLERSARRAFPDSAFFCKLPGTARSRAAP